MVKIVFVCLGNICRSPLAEASFRKLVQEHRLAHHFEINSAGTAGYHVGKRPDRRALEVLEEKGIETGHLGKKLSAADLDYYDHIVVMDEQNFEDVHNLYHSTKKVPPAPDKVFLIRDYDPEVRGVQEVPDPYYENIEEFRKVYDIVDRSNAALLDMLVDKYNLEPMDEEDESEEDTSDK